MTLQKVDIHLFPSEKDMKDEELSKVKVVIRPELEKLMTRIMRETTLIRITDLKKIGKILEEELGDDIILANRVSEEALTHCPDYPGIETETILGKFFALEQTFKGTEKANEDLHHVIQRIAKDKGISKEDLIKYFEDDKS